MTWRVLKHKWVDMLYSNNYYSIIMSLAKIRHQHYQNTRGEDLIFTLVALVCLTFSVLINTAHSFEHYTVSDQGETCCLLGSLDNAHEPVNNPPLDQATPVEHTQAIAADTVDINALYANYITRAPPTQS